MEPDKIKLAQLVFSDKEKLAKLNQIIHPKVAEGFEDWKHAQSAKVVVKEAAILIESGAYKTVDKVIVVSAPLDIRIARVMKRDGISKQEVEQRIQNQLTEEERLAYADFVLQNSGEEYLIPQVEEIIKELM